MRRWIAFLSAMIWFLLGAGIAEITEEPSIHPLPWDDLVWQDTMVDVLRKTGYEDSLYIRTNGEDITLMMQRSKELDDYLESLLGQHPFVISDVVQYEFSEILHHHLSMVIVFIRADKAEHPAVCEQLSARISDYLRQNPDNDLFDSEPCWFHPDYLLRLQPAVNEKWQGVYLKFYPYNWSPSFTHMFSEDWAQSSAVYPLDELVRS